ncbi:MAG: soluble lytic murein transglycosylase-like protein [Bacteroidota bacterium]|jgi:membrane-bound lytic murein transglycosylase D|nr:soluble lytic murein transglycosylase-like protein [Bacteroidota bacterium]
MKRGVNLIWLFVCLLIFEGSHSFSQETPQEVTGSMQDDPIASVLDSLYKLDLFEKGYAKINYTKNPKYQFPKDSVPRYDEQTYEARLAKIDAASPFDLQYNSIVKGYIEMYTIRKRELVSRMMALSQFYFPMFEEQLDKYNLPLELKYLAICESALNPMAKSRAGAMGLWQFMYPTGKMYGLKVSSYVDDRCDPYKSTIAACEYFKYLYGLFGDWQMVLAAYNGGPGTVNRAIRRSGGKKTYWEIRPYLPKETQGYVPAFIAVNYVMSYTSEHNMYSAIPKKTFLNVDTVHVKKQISFGQLAAILEIPIEDLQYMNPSYKKNVVPVLPDETSYLTLPSSKIGAFVNNEDKIYNFYKKDTINSRDVLASQEMIKIHTVKNGERLSTIANRYGCTVAELKQWNGIKSSTVKAGKKLTIYTYQKKPATVSASPAPEKKETAAPGAAKYKYYTVKKGDSLFKIAKEHNTTVEAIKQLNGFGSKYTLVPGKKLKVAKL